jgi:hypothetical protein
MTASSLQNHTAKDLAQIAKSQGVVGWHAMRKDQLIRALVSRAKRKQRKQVASRHGRLRKPVGLGANSEVLERLRELRAKLEVGKNLSTVCGNESRAIETDRLVVMVRDPYWLQAYWELAPRNVERAQAALGQNWHTARPVLRLFRVDSDGMGLPERDIAIHGGVSHWYIDVTDPPNEFRLEIGYLGTAGQFYCLARSNSVTTPPAGTSDSVDENWVDVDENADRIFAMSGGYKPQGTSLELQELLEERLRRPMGTPMETRFGSGAARVLTNLPELPLAIDAELLVFGFTHPHAHLTLQGEPLPVRPDGSFTARMSLSDRRQVIPVVASSPDGVEQQTIILAIERNTKVLERVVRNPGT